MDHDDIWSDSLKLRKQVDFMEENADYALCGTGLVTMNIS